MVIQVTELFIALLSNQVLGHGQRKLENLETFGQRAPGHVVTG
jgi:hypothetical protein